MNPSTGKYIGARFGRLVVVAMLHTNKWGESVAKCQCDCGKEHTTRLKSLKKGETSSCGCFGMECRIINQTTHGKTGTRTYRAWHNMKNRCHNPKVKSFSDYGAKGITVCDRWKHSFAAFLHDMGECPEGLTIERIDNAKGYFKTNCKWATRLEQGKNRSNNHVVTIGGVTRHLSEWSRQSGVNATTILGRIRRGWSEGRLLCLP